MKKKIVTVTVVIWCVAIVIVGCQNVSKSKASESLDKEKTSEELLDDVLSDKSIADVYLYNEPTDSINVVKNKCEELVILQGRQDYIETVIDKYMEYELANDFATDKNVIDSLTYVHGEALDAKLNELLVDETVRQSVEEDVMELSKIYFLECLITSKELVQESTSEQIVDIKEAAYDKYLEKLDTVLYTDMEESVYELADKSDTAQDLGVAINSRSQTAFVTTPNGSKVEVDIVEYNGDRWANTVTMEMKNEYPQVKILAKADNRYNCHSYAWYRQSTSNPYWMNNPMKFISDGSFKEAIYPSANDKVIWAVKSGRPYIEHSGIVVGVDNNEVVVVSKWGQGPLVKHMESYSPYVNKTYYYNRKK